MNKNKRVWKLVQNIAPRWYKLLRSMLQINPKKRCRSLEAMTIFKDSAVIKDRSIEYTCKVNIPPVINVDQKIKTLIDRYCKEYPKCIPIANRLFSKVKSTWELSQDEDIIYALCCCYIAVKFKNYQPPPPFKFFGKIDWSYILRFEMKILSLHRYRISM